MSSTPTFENSPPRPGWTLALVALIIPLIGAVGLTVVETYAQGVTVGAIVVISSALLIFIDALQLGNEAANGKKQTAPIIMLIGMLLLWVAYYPLSFVRRSRITGPNLSLVSVLIAAIFLLGPIGFFYVVPSSLPTCDNADVKELLLQLVRGTPLGRAVTKIDGHREISFDAATPRRHCQCIVHTGNTQTPLKYVIEWQGQSRVQYYVKTIAELPACTDNEVRELLEQTIRTLPDIKPIKALEEFKETSFDQAVERRTGQCILKTEDEESLVNFTLQWQTKDQGMFEVLVQPMLPGCKSKAVLPMLQQLIREQSGIAQITRIDGHKELKYDKVNDHRLGQCTVHAATGGVKVNYTIHWDQDKTHFLVELVPMD